MISSFLFSPNAREVNALKVVLFSLDPECVTTFNPSEVSDVRALKVEISFCSSGDFINLRFASAFLVLGL